MIHLFISLVVQLPKISAAYSAIFFLLTVKKIDWILLETLGKKKFTQILSLEFVLLGFWDGDYEDDHDFNE